MRRMSLVAALLSCVLVSGVVAGEPTYKEKIATLAKALKAKGASTSTITEAIDAVADGYASASTAEKKAGVAAIGKATKSSRPNVVLGSFEALALLRVPGSGKYLKPHLKIGKKGPFKKLQRAALTTAREIGDKAILNQLRKLSNHKLNEVASQATKALGGYTRLAPKDRKALAYELIARLQKLSRRSGGGRGYGRSLAESTNDNADETGVPDGQIGGDNKAEDRRMLLQGATRTAVGELTGLRFSAMSDWKKWVSASKSQKDPWKDPYK